MENTPAFPEPMIIRCALTFPYRETSMPPSQDLTFRWHLELRITLLTAERSHFNDLLVTDGSGGLTIQHSLFILVDQVRSSRPLRELVRGMHEVYGVTHYVLEYEEHFPRDYRANFADAFRFALRDVPVRFQS